MDKPLVFIGSSVEALQVAQVIQKDLQYDAESVIWNQGFFQLNLSTLEGLLTAIDRFDFSIFVFSPDDEITIKGDPPTRIPRDNVIFEFGLFLGRFGRSRTFVVRSTDNMRILTDLAGVTVTRYTPAAPPSMQMPAVGPACTDIKNVMKMVGSRQAEELSRRMKDLSERMSPNFIYILRIMKVIDDSRPVSHFRVAFHHFQKQMGESCASTPLKRHDGWDKVADYAFRYLESLGLIQETHKK